MTDEVEQPRAWPGFLAGLEPGASESPVSAALPPDLDVIKPSGDLPASSSAWSGAWSGWAGQGRNFDIKLIVESISASEAKVVCARASKVHGALFERVLARLEGNELVANLANGATAKFRMRNPSVVELVWHEANGSWIAGVLSQQNVEEDRHVSERVLTKMFEDGDQVALEIVTFKPDGPGPFPTLVFHHGSTGTGNDPSLFSCTVTSPALAKYFNDRGWMVLFPQRRGRGKSGGLYDEGFEPDRSRYSDDPQYALPGFERALEDITCVVDHMLARADVDVERLLIGGHSRGGFLALVFAGLRPQLFGGVLNYVGGWVDEHASSSELINTSIAKRGATPSVPSAWIYAGNDPFYSLEHSMKSFRAFEAAGGQGEFHVLETPLGHDGHHVLSPTEWWGSIVDDFLKRVSQQKNSKL